LLRSFSRPYGTCVGARPGSQDYRPGLFSTVPTGLLRTTCLSSRPRRRSSSRFSRFIFFAPCTVHFACFIFFAPCTMHFTRLPSSHRAPRFAYFNFFAPCTVHAFTTSQPCTVHFARFSYLRRLRCLRWPERRLLRAPSGRNRLSTEASLSQDSRGRFLPRAFSIPLS